MPHVRCTLRRPDAPRVSKVRSSATLKQISCSQIGLAYTIRFDPYRGNMECREDHMSSLVLITTKAGEAAFHLDTTEVEACGRA